MVRPGAPADLAAVGAIQASSPGAAQWEPADYLAHELWVAALDGAIAGFLAGRKVTEGEYELLNLAVSPEFRRRGIGRELFAHYARRACGAIYLEVRKSNHTARNFYKSVGFQQVAVRPRYYESPPEDGIVMKFHSC